MRLLPVLLTLILVTSACLGSGPVGKPTPSRSDSTMTPPENSQATPVSREKGDNSTTSFQNASSVASPPENTSPEPSEGSYEGTPIESWAYWLQNASPEVIAESGFELVVMDYSRDGSDESAYTREEIETIKKAGVIPIAYISIGEAEDYRFYWVEGWKTDPPQWLGPENPEWRGNYAVKYWEDGWKGIVFSYLDRIISQGFSGVYLDKVDEFEYWAERGYKENWTAGEMIDLIIEIANYTRSRAGGGFMIIPQNGERLLEYDNGRLLEAVSGWASEDVFYDGLEPSPWRDEKVPLLDRVVEAGKLVLVVDYVDDGTNSPENLNRVRDFIRQARARGYVPYASMEDRELDELVIIPGVQPPR